MFRSNIKSGLCAAAGKLGVRSRVASHVRLAKPSRRVLRLSSSSHRDVTEHTHRELWSSRHSRAAVPYVSGELSQQLWNVLLSLLSFNFFPCMFPCSMRAPANAPGSDACITLQRAGINVFMVRLWLEAHQR